MRVFLQAMNSTSSNSYNVANANSGFSKMGFETIFFNSLSELSCCDKSDIVVGGVGTIHSHLLNLGIEVPNIDYPIELGNYLGRRVWSTFFDEVCKNSDSWPVFVKSFNQKEFTGFVVNNSMDLLKASCSETTPVWCSEIVNFKAEWRCFIRYGKVIDVRRYNGDWRLNFDYKVVENIVKDYENCPKGCAIDIGVTDSGKTLLIEVNDGYALGSYGLNCIDYAKLLSARWSELTNTEDLCAFDIM